VSNPAGAVFCFAGAANIAIDLVTFLKENRIPIFWLQCRMDDEPTIEMNPVDLDVRNFEDFGSHIFLFFGLA
jgi:hypothetical protein